MPRKKKGELLGIVDAQKIAERFLLSLHPGAKVFFDRALLRAIGRETVYELGGYVSIGGGLPPSGARERFKVQVQAYAPRIVGYY